MFGLVVVVVLFPFLFHSTSIINVRNSSTQHCLCACRILGRPRFFWGWRKSWKPKNLRRMILLKLSFIILVVGPIVWWFDFTLYYTCCVCPVVHLTYLLTECTCGFNWIGLTEFKKWVFNEVAWVRSYLYDELNNYPYLFYTWFMQTCQQC